MKERITISENGPYLVEGDISIKDEIIVNDADDNPLKYKDGEKYPKKEGYHLCRCGKSGHKPFCDGSHIKTSFDGEETADNKKYEKSCEKYSGPLINLADKEELCSAAGFCHRKGGTWELTGSNNPKDKELAICQCGNCPSGRLVAYDKKTGKPIEPKFDKSISLIENTEGGFSGPIWVKGGIPIESQDGTKYEVRNRVTLCRCGKSNNKPFCDGTHIDVEFDSKN